MESLIATISDNLVVIGSFVTAVLTAVVLLWCRRSSSPPQYVSVDDDYWTEDSQRNAKKSISKKSNVKKNKPDKGKTIVPNGHMVTVKQATVKPASNFAKPAVDATQHEKAEVGKQKQVASNKKQQKLPSVEPQGEWTIAGSKKKPKSKKDDKPLMPAGALDKKSVDAVIDEQQLTDEVKTTAQVQPCTVELIPDVSSTAEVKQILNEVTDDLSTKIAPTVADRSTAVSDIDAVGDLNSSNAVVGDEDATSAVLETVDAVVVGTSKSSARKKKKNTKVSKETSQGLSSVDKVETAETVDVVMNASESIVSSSVDFGTEESHCFLDKPSENTDHSVTDVTSGMMSDNAAVSLESNCVSSTVDCRSPCQTIPQEPSIKSSAVVFDELGDEPLATSAPNKKKKKARRDN